MKNKILVNVYVPSLDESYDIWIPYSDKVGSVAEIMCTTINDLSDSNFNYEKGYAIINVETAEVYDLELPIKNTNIRNGKKLIIL